MFCFGYIVIAVVNSPHIKLRILGVAIAFEEQKPSGNEKGQAVEAI